jgi:hypothetical protein
VQRSMLGRGVAFQLVQIYATLVSNSLSQVGASKATPRNSFYETQKKRKTCALAHADQNHIFFV